MRKVLIAVIAIGLQLLWWPSFGSTDTQFWIDLAQDQQLFGLHDGYAYFNAHYPPLASVFVYPAQWMLNYQDVTLSLFVKVLPIKLILAIFFYGLWCLLVWYFRRQRKLTWPQTIGATLPYLLNVAMIENTIILSYLDILFAPFLFLNFYWLYRQKYWLAGMALALAFMTKLLPILIIPICLVYVFRSHLTKDYNWRGLIYYCVGMGSVMLPLLGYFGVGNVIEAIKTEGNQGRELSYAFNLPYVIRYFQGNNVASSPLFYGSKVIILALLCITLIWLWRRAQDHCSVLYGSLIIFSAYFFLHTGVHENHLMPAVYVATAAFLFKRRLGSTLWYYGMMAAAFLNMFIPYGFGFDPTIIDYPTAGERLLPNILLSYLPTAEWLMASVMVIGWVALMCYTLRLKPEVLSSQR